MIHCPKCEKDVNPTIDLGGDFGMGGNRAPKPVLLCPQCEQWLGTPEAGHVAAAAAPRLAPVVQLRNVPSTAKPVHILESGSLTDRATARLAQIDAELARMNELKFEARGLRAMLKAVDRACKPK